MESYLKLVLILIVVTFADDAHSQGISASDNPIAVGSNVTLSSMTSVSRGIWIFNNAMVVFISPGSSSITDPRSGRITYDSNTSSLSISSVEQEDSGVYTLQDLVGFKANLTLSVQVPISNVALQAKATDLVETNDTVVLMCSVSAGTSLSYTWLKGNDTITAGGNVEISDGGATLRMKAHRLYQGPFRCNVSNGVSNGVSNPIMLTISYGPSNINLTIKPPMMSSYKIGSNITLSCTAESSPAAMVQWMFNGVSLNQYEAHLKLENVTQIHSGNYVCLLNNSMTKRFSSASAMIWILDPLTSVMVTHSKPPTLHGSFTLQCEVKGTVDSIYWKKNGQPISADNTTFFGMGNKTLTLNPVQHSDSGSYQCQAFNSVSNTTSDPYPVMVYYGPMKPVITGPHVARTGDKVTLSCNASSKPQSSYEWSRNGHPLSNVSDYVTPPLTLNMTGKYVCTAFNHITGKNSTAYKMLTVIDPIEKVHVEGQMNPAMEGYAYNLTCYVTGPADHIYWMKNGMRLYEDNSATFYMNNKTVMFMPVDRYDTGHYQCKVKNAVENMTSNPYALVVKYGPDTPTIKGPAYAEAGRYAVFTCSAMSEPPSRYSWWFQNNSVANTSMFKTDVLSFNMSGVYTCKAYNNMTMKSNKSSKMLTVIEGIKSVTIQKSSIPIQNENFTLTCVVVGPYDSIYWMKDNMTLDMNGSMMNGSMMNSSMMNSSMMNSSMTSNWMTTHTSYRIKNNTLHFSPVTTDNDGVYHCVATNKAGHHKSPKYHLLVNYGPLSVAITGPQWINQGSQISLTCSADSRPECKFSWFFNNDSMPLNNGPVTSFPVTLQALGTYICKARNPVTNITMYQSKMVTIGGQDSTFYFASRNSLMVMVVSALSATWLFN